MKTHLIGIGHEFRRDDGVGIWIARTLEEARHPELEVLVASGEGTLLMEAWEGRERVVVLDAVRAHDRPGTIHRFDAGDREIPSDFFRYSTHSFGLAEAVELSRALGILPASLQIYGITGASFEAGQGLSRQVEVAARQVIAEILEKAQSVSVR